MLALALFALQSAVTVLEGATSSLLAASGPESGTEQDIVEALDTSQSEPTWRTSRNLEILNSLDPSVANLAAEHLHLTSEAGLDARLAQGYRSYEEQNELYAQGGTGPGRVVTNARGGQSWHNFRLAYDIALYDERGRYISSGADPRYRQAGELGESVGLEWGGRWRGPDVPHFQFTGGLPIGVVRQRWEAGEDVFR